MSKALVLHSGGLDSTVLLYDTIKKFGADNVYTLSLTYGQKHHKEIACANYHANKIWGDKADEHTMHYDMADIFERDKNCTLLCNNGDIPTGSYVDQQNATHSTTVSTYVPFRNGLFLSTAVSLAIQIGCNVVMYGAHADDMAGSAYPDCSELFVQAMQAAIKSGTGNQVNLVVPFLFINKAAVVAKGIAAGMSEDDFNHTWSCYEGGDEPCGKCATCIDRRKAFEANGMDLR